MREVVDGALDAMLIADDAGNYVDVNPAACSLFGVPREALLRRNVHELSGSPLSGANAWRDFLRDGRAAGHFRLLRPDGECRDVDYRATANILPNLHLSVLRDVTERQLAEARLQALSAVIQADEASGRRAEEQLSQAQKIEAVGAVAGGVAHELNNLLTVIMTYTMLMMEPLKPDDPTLADLEEVRGAAERATELTRQLLALASVPPARCATS
jgi:PAS domain S-box-containing protein